MLRMGFMVCEQEVHGHCLIPADYANPREVGWVEAARWVTRNAKLFSKGKLTDKRYQLIRDVLGAMVTRKRRSGHIFVVRMRLSHQSIISSSLQWHC